MPQKWRKTKTFIKFKKQIIFLKQDVQIQSTKRRESTSSVRHFVLVFHIFYFLTNQIASSQTGIY